MMSFGSGGDVLVQNGFAKVSNDGSVVSAILKGFHMALFGRPSPPAEAYESPCRYSSPSVAYGERGSPLRLERSLL